MESKGLFKAMGELDLLFNYIETYLASKRHRNLWTLLEHQTIASLCSFSRDKRAPCLHPVHNIHKYECLYQPTVVFVQRLKFYDFVLGTIVVYACYCVIHLNLSENVIFIVNMCHVYFWYLLINFLLRNANKNPTKNQFAWFPCTICYITAVMWQHAGMSKHTYHILKKYTV